MRVVGPGKTPTTRAEGRVGGIVGKIRKSWRRHIVAGLGGLGGPEGDPLAGFLLDTNIIIDVLRGRRVAKLSFAASSLNRTQLPVALSALLRFTPAPARTRK